MNVLKKIPMLWWMAFLFGAFLISCAFAFRYGRGEGRKIRTLVSVHRELQTLSKTESEKLEQLALRTEDRVSPPEALFRTWIQNDRLTLSPPVITDLPEGYRHHKLTVKIEKMLPHELAELLETAENALPPWRVVRAGLKTDSRGVQGELLLEALDKSPPEL